MTSTLQTFKQIGFFTIALTLALVANFAYGEWANPTTEPTGGNIAAPINESGLDQIKVGDLGVDSMYVASTTYSDRYCNFDGPVCLTAADLQALKDIIAGGGLGGPITTIRQLNGLQGAVISGYRVDSGGYDHTISRIIVPEGVTHAIVSASESSDSRDQRVFAVTAGDVIESSPSFASAGFSTAGKWAYARARSGRLQASGYVSGLNIIPTSGTLTPVHHDRSRESSNGDRSDAVLFWAQP